MPRKLKIKQSRDQGQNNWSNIVHLNSIEKSPATNNFD